MTWEHGKDGKEQGDESGKVECQYAWPWKQEKQA